MPGLNTKKRRCCSAMVADDAEVQAALLDEKKKQEIGKQIQQKQVEFSLMIERQKSQKRQK